MAIEQRYAIVAWGAPMAQDGGKWQLAWNVGNPPNAPQGGVHGAIRTEFGGGYVVGTTDLRDGRWHHVVSVFQGSGPGGDADRIRHYVDGRLEKVSAVIDGQINTRLLEARSRPTYIGRRLEDDFPEFGLKGGIDELYIFPCALTPEQIQELYQNNSPPVRTIRSEE